MLVVPKVAKRQRKINMYLPKRKHLIFSFLVAFDPMYSNSIHEGEEEKSMAIEIYTCSVMKWIPKNISLNK